MTTEVGTRPGPVKSDSKCLASAFKSRDRLHWGDSAADRLLSRSWAEDRSWPVGVPRREIGNVRNFALSGNSSSVGRVPENLRWSSTQTCVARSLATPVSLLGGRRSRALAGAGKCLAVCNELGVARNVARSSTNRSLIFPTGTPSRCHPDPRAGRGRDRPLP